MKTRQKITALFLGLLLALCTLEFAIPLFSTPWKFRRPEGSGEQNVLCMGNSYTAGVGAEIGHSYCDRIQARLEAAFPHRGFKVLNLGAAGKNSSEVLASLPAELQQYKPALVLLMTGEPNSWNHDGYDRFLRRKNREAKPFHDFFQKFHIYRLSVLLFSSLKNSGSPAGSSLLFPDVPLSDPRALGFRWFGYLYPLSQSRNWPALDPAEWSEAESALVGLHELTRSYHFTVPLLLARMEESHFGRISEATRWYEESLKIRPSDFHLDAYNDLSSATDRPDWRERLARTALMAKRHPGGELEERPADAQLRIEKFHRLRGLGRLDEALAFLKESLRLNPFGFQSSPLNQFHLLSVDATAAQRKDILAAMEKELAEFRSLFPSRTDYVPGTEMGETLQEWIAHDIAEIAALVKNKGAQLHLQTYPPRRDGSWRVENRAIRSAAASGAIPLADVEEFLKAKFPDRASLEKLYSNDGGARDNHLNNQGYAVLGDFIFESLLASRLVPGAAGESVVQPRR